MSNSSLEEAKQLINETYQLTGQKVEMDDPIVVAALVQSSLIKQAGQDAAASMRLAAEQVARDLVRGNINGTPTLMETLREKGWIIGLVACLIGAGIGASWAGKVDKTEEEKQQLQAGKDIMRIWPTLDETTKNKLVRLMQRK